VALIMASVTLATHVLSGSKQLPEDMGGSGLRP